MMSPTSIAMPTVTPTRWPTPMSSIDRLADTVVAPEPTPKDLAASEASSFVCASA